MEDLNINLQPRTKIQQATNSTSDSNNNGNSKRVQEENKLFLFGLLEYQAANESPSSNFVDRYQNDNLRDEKLAESLGISIAIQDIFCLDKYSSNNPKERPLEIKVANHRNYRIVFVSINKLKEKKMLVKKVLGEEGMLEENICFIFDTNPCINFKSSNQKNSIRKIVLKTASN